MQKRTDRRNLTMKNDRTGKGATIDRRVARTRSALQDALLALVAERGYASITVEDICRKANVGRSTFYAHYPGKNELRSAMIDLHMKSLTRHHETSKPPSTRRLLQFSLPMFEYAHAFRSLHQALLASGGDAFHDELRQRIRQTVRRELADKASFGRDIPADFLVEYVVGAFLSVLAWWIATQAELSPAKIDEMFLGVAAQGING